MHFSLKKSEPSWEEYGVSPPLLGDGLWQTFCLRVKDAS